MLLRLLALTALTACSTGVPIDPHEVKSAEGLYTLHMHADDPVAGELTTFGFHLLHDGDNVTGATVAVTPYMPDMGHGITDEPVVTEGEDALYEAVFTYSMGGYWELTIDIDAEPGADQAIVAYEVP
jgi:hypothetical protein